MRIVGIVFCLLVLGLVGYSALTFKAPAIEADLQARAELALGIVGEDEIAVSVDGRRATLRGMIATDEMRAELLEVIAALPGVLGPDDELTVIPRVSPYRLAAAKTEANEITIKGHAPTAAIKGLIAVDAQIIFGDEVAIDIEVANGAPDGDWRAAATSAFDVLATMSEGEVTILDDTLSIDGEVKSDDDIEAINFFVSSAPEDFTWTRNLSVDLEQNKPYSISVIKTPGADLKITGFAPDAATREAFIAAGAAISDGEAVVADIEITDGMPDQEWPVLVQAGICLLYTSPSPRDKRQSRMPSSA